MRKTTLWWIIGTMALVGVVCTALAVYAQPPPGAPGAPGGGPGGPGGGGRGMGGLLAAPPVITVANGKVYVVYLGTLFKLNADTLEEEAQVHLQPKWLQQMMGAGGAPGQPPPPPPGAAQ